MENWEFDELIEAVEEEFNDKKLGIINHPEIWGIETDADFTAAAATENDFTGPGLDEESEQTIVRLTLFLCVEKCGRIYKAVYEDLDTKINNYKRENLLKLTEKEKDRIEEMISYYKKRIKELDIVRRAVDDSFIIYRLDENNELKRIK